MNREIDALVAEHIFGWGEVTFNAEINAATGRTPSRTGGMDGRGFAWIPRYSEDISAAWEVVERMKTDDWSFRFSNNAWANGQQSAAFFKAVNAIGKDILAGDYVYEDNAWVIADSAPLAICKAALKAKGVETEGRGE
jgi:hypothetical protein